MARDQREDREYIYAAADRFVDSYLRGEDSLFTPGASMAALANLQELHRRFNAQPDEGAASFLDKFERQLAGADDDVIQLAAELLYVHLLFAADIGGRSKRDTIGRVCSWMQQPADVPAELDKALDVGLANTGIAFKTYRPHQLWFLIDTLSAWNELDGQVQVGLLSDPWAFKRFLFDIPLNAAYTQREALLHLVHPDSFESIVSRDHKRMIVEAFEGRLEAPVGDVDRALLEIRASLTQERPDFRWFYEPGVVEVWRPSNVADDENDTGTKLRAWLVRHKVSGKPRIEAWLQDGYASIGWRELGASVVGASRDEIAAAFEEAFPDDPPGRRRNSLGNVERFLRQINVGDIVVTTHGDRIYVGVITSGPRFVDHSDESFRRTVEWANPQQPISRSQLQPSSYSKLRALLTVSDVSEDAVEFAALGGLELSELDPDEAPVAKHGVQLPTADSALADDLLLPRDWLQETIELLADKRQVVFYGPPGTGKTYVAQRLGDHLTQDGGNYLVVQFHPSYAYEDFFEGFRPRESVAGTGVSFELAQGPLRRLAEEAMADPDSPYVLIIDEINRANLAKVFGELYFLLEYRDQAIALQYSPEVEFKLPPNLYVIGTMNTADRSIALVDAAMRRRFYFVGFFPQREPVAGLLDAWLARQGYDRRPARLLQELNQRIDDEDFAVGPSYLMTPQAQTDAGLERIWRHGILPLLEEHYLGAGVDVEQRFGLQALRRGLALEQSTAATDGAIEAVGTDEG